MSEMITGVILAAGKGSRMYPFSERLPKPLMPILNRPLLAHQLDQMVKVGIRKVIIVVGYYGFEIVRAIGDGSEWGIEISYVDQERTLGIAHAVGQLESRVDGPFLLFLGDIFFHVRDLGEMVRPVLSGQANAVLAAKRENDPTAIRRNFSILQTPDGTVSRVIEKPRHPTSNLKGCGLYAFDSHIFDAVRRTPRTASRDEYEITDSIQLLIQDGFRVEVMDGIEYDINLTYPEDLLVVNRDELAHRGQKNLIGNNYQGPDPARISNSVIGDDVTIRGEVAIKEAIIFKGSELELADNLENVIITPEQRVALSRS